MSKKTRAALISLMLAISVTLPGLVLGDGSQAYASGKLTAGRYDELVEAINQAGPGDTIEITSDIVVTSELVIDKDLSIKGKGHTLSVPIPGLDDSGRLNPDPSSFRVFNLVSGQLTIEELTIKGGAAGAEGSGIRVAEAASLRLDTCTVSHSGGRDAPGGGIANRGTCYLNHCDIIRNGASYGGGFFNVDASAKMYVENSSFSENRSLSASGGGGAGENKTSALLYVNNSSFSNNKSTELGGAINNYGGTAYILNSSFTGNVNYYSSGKGGALRISGFVYLINSLFAYNYSSNDKGANYKLNDYDSTPTGACYCLFHGSPMEGTNNVAYEGQADGSDDSLFTGGSTGKVLDADGLITGTASIYQPFLARVGNSYTVSIPLRPESSLLGAGTPTGFGRGEGSPVIGYFDPASETWINLLGEGAGNFQVTSDQNGSPRGGTPAIGAVETVTAALYMIKVNGAEGGSVNGGSIYGDTYADGASVALTAIPYDNFKFVSWSNASDSTELSTANPYNFTVTGSLTIQPVFEALETGEYTVTYIGNGQSGGSVPDPVISKEAITLSGNTGDLYKTGYAFAGWNTRANGSGTSYAGGDSYSAGKNLTLYAQWKRELTVTFDSQGGTHLDPVTAIEGSYIQVPARPTKAGWDFDAWYKDAGYTELWDFDSDEARDHMTLYARWTPIPVLFNKGSLVEGTYHKAYSAPVRASGGSGSYTYQVLEGKLPPGLSLSTAGVITGTPTSFGQHRFTIKVTDTLNGTSAEAEFTLKIAPLGQVASPVAIPGGGMMDYGDRVRLAVSTANARIYYTTDGGTPSAQSKLYLEPIELYQPTLIKAVALKEGWEDSALVELSYSIKAYAVTYEGNGASGGSAPYDANLYRKGEKVTVPGNSGALTKTGHHFAGWNTKADGRGTPYVEGDELPVQEDTLLFAAWSINQYRVTFKDWDGKEMATQMVDHGSAASAPAQPQREGYRFTGWSRSFDSILGQTQVTARYEKIHYKVSFKPALGTPIDSQSVAYMEKVIRPQDPIREGYRFGGWYSDSGLTLPYDFDSLLTGDRTLYAAWLEIPLPLEDLALALTREVVFGFAEGDSWDFVTENFTILGQGDKDTELSWTSSRPDIVEVRALEGEWLGLVKRPQAKDAPVILTASISRGDQKITRTFHLIVRQKGMPPLRESDTQADGSSLSLGGNSYPLSIYLRVLEDGSTLKRLTLPPEILEAILGQGGPGGQITVSFGQGEGHPTGDYAFEIGAESLARLLESQLGANLTSPAGALSISARNLEIAYGTGHPLYIRIQLLEKEAEEAEKAFLGDRTIFSQSGGETGRVLGPPRWIESNVQGLESSITLPLAGLDQAELAGASFLGNLRIYGEYLDGGTGLLEGILLYTDKLPSHIQFDTDQYGRFQVVSLEKKPVDRSWTWIPYGAAALVLIVIFFTVLKIYRRRPEGSR